MNGKPRNPRRVRQACIALLLGTATTVVMAWLAMFLPWSDQRRWHGPPTDIDIGTIPRSDGAKTFQVTRGSNAWHDVTSYWWMQISGQSMTMMSDDPAYRRIEPSSLPAHMRPRSIDDLEMLSWYHATGWPMRAMTCGVHWEDQILNSDIVYSVSGGVQLPRDAEFNPRALPLKPLWPGFAMNTLVFAAAWWMLLCSAGALRRRHRSRRNRCGSCGYSRQGLAIESACPECGASVQNR